MQCAGNAVGDGRPVDARKDEHMAKETTADKSRETNKPNYHHNRLKGG